MDLKTNICDSIKECEVKLGYQEKPIRLYYPESTLLELLQAEHNTLSEKITWFCQTQAEIFGGITIAETQEKGRYCIDISAKGVKYVHKNITVSPFMTAFIQEIHKSGTKKEDIVKLFYKFSENIVVEKMEEKEWGVYFRDGIPDAYVYYIEEDDFGLQYHRFTRETFERLKEN